MSIVYSSRFDKLTEYNASFDRGVLRVCYVGENRNKSFISKATFDRCMPSIYNCPIVCRYDREVDEIGAHDMDVVKKSDGSYDLVNLTNPVGVIPESARYWYEEVEEEDGSVHEYLFVDALLWKRQEAYRKIKEDGITDESMEINVKGGHMEDGVFIIEDFEFTAFCLLGTAEPCYESASLLLFSRDEFQRQLDEMMRDFKESFSLVQPSQEVVITNQNNLKGGEEALDEKRVLMAQYGLSEEMLDFNLDDHSIEELTEKFREIIAKHKADKAKPEPVEDDKPEIVEGDKPETFALAEQFKEELINALYSVTIETCFGEMARYWYVDYDADACEVYCYDSEDWKLYGFTYSMNGDNVVVDFESKKRKKFAIEDFDEGEQSVPFAGVFSIACERYAENDEQWSAKFQTASESMVSMENELNELREFKRNIEQAAENKARDEVFERFEDLDGIEAFETLLENCSKYSIEDIEERCYAIRGRKHTGKFALDGQKPVKLPIERVTVIDDEPYGGVFVKYGIE